MHARSPAEKSTGHSATQRRGFHASVRHTDGRDGATTDTLRYSIRFLLSSQTVRGTSRRIEGKPSATIMRESDLRRNLGR